MNWCSDSFMMDLVRITGCKSPILKLGIPYVPDVQYPDEPTRNSSTIRIEDLLAGDEPAATSPPPVREGLPRSFRMRADKHYVEMLDAPAARVGADLQVGPVAPASPVGADLQVGPDVQTTASMSPTPTVPRAVGERHDAEASLAAVRAGNELAQSLSALRTSTNLLADRGGLASTVAANLIRAEAWRATCLLQVSRFLRGEVTPSLKAVHARAVVDRVLEAIEAERRLRGVRIERRINVGDRRIATDEELLVGALSGLLMTMIASSEPTDSVVAISAESSGNEVAFTITHGSDIDTDWTRRLVGLTRMVNGIGGAVTIPPNSLNRVSLTFPIRTSPDL